MQQFNFHGKRGLAAVAMALLVGATLAACGGGGGGGGAVTPAPNPNPNPDPTPNPIDGPAWPSFARDAQHAANAGIATQALTRIVWQTPVDVAPQYSAQGYLLYHYGSPVISARNTVVVPVKRAVQKNYKIEGRDGLTGTLLWSVDSDYAMPASNWTPSYNVTLLPDSRLVAPGAGGKVYYRENVDKVSGALSTKAFYGDAVYTANKAALDLQVIINTPITTDSAGNIWFGYTADAGNAAGVASGIARIGANGAGSWTGAAAVSADSNIQKMAHNSAPALSTDQKTLYVVVNGVDSQGYLLALDSTTLALKRKVRLSDPDTGAPSRISDDSTASPTVGPDGDLYIGVLEPVYGAHNARGWLLHFNADLSLARIPGSFGWDDTASIVPAAMVPGYLGASPYLIMVKYNNYGRAGSGDSKNKVAILDPNASQPDFISGKSVMKDVLTILGPTPDPSFPGGVTEWCINTAAIDPFTKSVLVNSEDGYLYRWDLATNTLSQSVRLTSGIGESYTPTAIGADGKVYAINNAILFAIGK